MEDRLSHEIHNAGLGPERWPDLMSRLSDRFDGASVFLCQGPMDRPSDGDAWSHNYDLAEFRCAPAQLWTEAANPVVSLMQRAPVCLPIDRQSFLDDTAVDRHPVGRQLLLKQRLFHVVLAVAQRDAETASQIFIGRSRRSRSFEADEITRFERLSAHVGRAMRMHRALGRLEARSRHLAQVLDGLAQAVMLTDGGLRVLHTNAAAERLLEAGDGLRHFRGMLRLHDADASRRLERAAQGLSARTPAYADTSIRAPRPSRAAAFRLQVFPALGDGTSGLARPRASSSSSTIRRPPWTLWPPSAWRPTTA